MITRDDLQRTITIGDLHRTTNKERIGGTCDKMGQVTLSNATTNTESEVMGQNG